MKKELRLLAVLLLCTISMQAQWLYWGDGQYNNFQANPWAGVQLDLALRFEPSDLTAYEGKSLTRMKFHPGPVTNTANYQLKIWEAEPGVLPVLVYSQPVSSVTFSQWNEIELTTPWPIDTSKELWFGVSIDQGGTVGFDAGPAETGKGNKFGNGIEWYDWGNGNWIVQAYAENASVTYYTLTVEAQPGEGGAVTGGGSYQAGETIPVEATANPGYQFQYWMYGDENIYEPAFDFTMPEEDVTLTAVFEPEAPPVWLFWGDGEYSNFQANPWAGVQLDLALRFEPSDLTDHDGKSLTKMKFHPGPVENSAAYKLKIWEAEPGQLPVLMYTQDVDQVTFNQWNEIDLTTTWTIDASKELWFGVSIDQGGTVGFDAGPAEPGKGNKFGNGIEWYDWGNGNWLVQALVTSGGVISYNLSLVADPAEGGNVSGAGNYPAGAGVDVEATASPDFAFVNWTNCGDVVSTEPAFTFTMPEENVTLTANFESTIPHYTLSLSANPANGGVLTGAGEYEAGEEITVTAAENEGFSFVNWTLNGSVISNDESFVYVMPAENIELTANFDMVYPEFYQVTIGEGQTYPEQVRMPLDFDWRNSVSQTLYYPEELGISRGVIDKLTYYKNFSQDVMNKEVKVWMGETTRQHLASGWISPTELTLVFDGTVDFPQGPGEIDIPLDIPFEYNGGVLVIYSNRAFEQQYYSWNERFFATKDTGRYRTRQFNEDVPIDVMDPSLSANYLLDWHPNTTLSFPTTMLGGIEGIVTDGSQPLEGVKVTIEGTTAVTYTNSSGYYSIPFILADTYEIRFNKLGYMTHIETDFAIAAGEIHPLDAALDESTQVQVSGILQGNDGVFVQDAAILLSGNSDYTTTSGPNGQFGLENVYEGLYTLTVTTDDYLEYIAEDVLITEGNADLGTIILTEKIIPPLGLTVNTENQEPGNALLSWYHGEQQEYRYDNGTYTYWVGSANGNINSVFGSAYRSDAVLTEVSWYLTSEEGIVFPEVKVWIFGLDRSGVPDTSNVLYTKENVTNINDEWNVHELDQPIVAPNGFLVGISYPGFYALGCDDGLDPEWPFTENTLYYVEYGETDFIPIESLVAGWGLNFMIRAYGVNNQELNRGIAARPVNQTVKPEIVLELAAAPHTPEVPFVSKTEKMYREFTGYNIYIDNMDEPYNTVSETQYLLEYLPSGEYLAGVQTVYTSGASEIVTQPFEIQQGAPPQNITLPAGWSGWSAYNMPSGDNTFAGVIAPVADEMIYAQYFDRLYFPQYGINSMGDFSNTHGYVSKMSSEAELTISGLRALTSIELSEGWNLIPVLSHCNVNTEALFGSMPELIIAFEVAGNGIYWPGLTNTLEYLIPGKAYWAKVTDDCTLSFPGCTRGELGGYTAPKRCVGDTMWNDVAYTGTSHIMVFDHTATEKLIQGDVIGAFTADGTCAGINLYDGNDLSLAIYGDDATTPEKDGFEEGETIFWQVSRPAAQTTYPAGVTYSPEAPNADGSFTHLGMSRISNIEMNVTGMGNHAEHTFTVYPNPSNGSFRIINIESGGMKYRIQNAAGITVKSGILGADGYIVLDNQPDGVYFLFLGDQPSVPKKLIRK